MDPFGAQTQNSGKIDPFLSMDKPSFPGGINPFLSLEVIPPTQEGAQFGTDPFAQEQTAPPPPNNDPFQQDAGTDPFGQMTGFDTSDPFGAPADDPFKSSTLNQDPDPFKTDPFASTQGSDPFDTDPFPN